MKPKNPYVRSHAIYDEETRCEVGSCYVSRGQCCIDISPGISIHIPMDQLEEWLVQVSRAGTAIYNAHRLLADDPKSELLRRIEVEPVA